MRRPVVVSTYHSIDLAIWRSIYRCIDIHLSINISMDLSSYRSINLPKYHYADLPIYVSAGKSASHATDLSIRHFFDLSGFRLTYLSFYQSLDLSL